MPIAIWIMFILALVIAYVARRLPFGRHVYAIGDNERAAELSGVKVRQVKVWVYTLSGFCAAIAGLSCLPNWLPATRPMAVASK